jgi:hypothetical protein
MANSREKQFLVFFEWDHYWVQGRGRVEERTALVTAKDFEEACVKLKDRFAHARCFENMTID